MNFMLTSKCKENMVKNNVKVKTNVSFTGVVQLTLVRLTHEQIRIRSIIYKSCSIFKIRNIYKYFKP